MGILAEESDIATADTALHVGEVRRFTVVVRGPAAERAVDGDTVVCFEVLLAEFQLLICGDHLLMPLTMATSMTKNRATKHPEVHTSPA